jgi:hypothetical protein
MIHRSSRLEFGAHQSSDHRTAARVIGHENIGCATDYDAVPSRAGCREKRVCPQMPQMDADRKKSRIESRKEMGADEKTPSFISAHLRRLRR